MHKPLINERDKAADGLIGLDSDVVCDLSCPNNPESTFRLNTWTVPLSLETANHWAVGEKARLYISARSAPLRTWNHYYHSNFKNNWTHHINRQTKNLTNYSKQSAQNEPQPKVRAVFQPKKEILKNKLNTHI